MYHPNHEHTSMFDPGEYIRQIATHYPDSDSIRRVLGFAEADLLHIDIDGKPINIWFEALREIQRQSKLEKCLQVISTEYPALQLDPENIYELQNFLEEKTIPAEKTKSIPFSYILIGISFILFVFLLVLFVGKNRGDKNIHILLFDKDDTTQLITSGKLTIQSTSANQTHELDINSNGLMVINDPEPWMHNTQVKIKVTGKANDTNPVLVDSILQLTRGDTTKIAVIVQRKNVVPAYTFIRLNYNGNAFEFPGDASVLMLKKYIMSIFDSKAGLPADRQILLYAGKEWDNDVLLEEIPWTEERGVAIKYRLSSSETISSMTIQMEHIDMQGGLAFLNDVPGEVMVQTGTNAVIKFPKLVGESDLRIFFKDSLLRMPLVTEYTDSGKYFNRSDFNKYLQRIHRTVK